MGRYGSARPGTESRAGYAPGVEQVQGILGRASARPGPARTRRGHARMGRRRAHGRDRCGDAHGGEDAHSPQAARTDARELRGAVAAAASPPERPRRVWLSPSGAAAASSRAQRAARRPLEAVRGLRAGYPALPDAGTRAFGSQDRENEPSFSSGPPEGSDFTELERGAGHGGEFHRIPRPDLHPTQVDGKPG